MTTNQVNNISKKHVNHTLLKNKIKLDNKELFYNFIVPYTREVPLTMPIGVKVYSFSLKSNMFQPMHNKSNT